VITDFRFGPRKMTSTLSGPIHWNQRSHILKFLYITQLSYKQLFRNCRASAINIYIQRDVLFLRFDFFVLASFWQWYTIIFVFVGLYPTRDTTQIESQNKKLGVPLKLQPSWSFRGTPWLCTVNICVCCFVLLTRYWGIDMVPCDYNRWGYQDSVSETAQEAPTIVIQGGPSWAQ